MNKVLFINHLKNSQYIHGGHVYRKSIENLLSLHYYDIDIKNIYFTDQRHRHVRRIRQVIDLIKSLFSRLPAKVLHFKSKSFQNNLISLFEKNSFDRIFINGAEMLWCQESIPIGTPVTYIAHNVEHVLYRQQVQKYLSVPGVGYVLRRDANKYEQFEISNLAKISSVIAISPADKKSIEHLCPRIIVEAILPSFSYPRSKRNRGRLATGKIRLGFVGNMEWWPNKRSLNWFLDDIFPEIAARYELHLYGQGSDRYAFLPGVVGHGFVPDLQKVWQECQLMIQPITHGSGINIKVAEALYNRMPIVATSMALRGIKLQEDQAVKVLDGEKKWIDYLKSNEVLSQLGRQVRMVNANLFSEEHNVESLKKIIKKESRKE